MHTRSISQTRTRVPGTLVPGERDTGHLLLRPGRRRVAAPGGSLLGVVLALAEPTQDVGLLDGESEGGEHGRPAVLRGAADGAAALGPDVGLAVEEEEQDLVRARAQLRHRAPALRDPAGAAAGGVCTSNTRAIDAQALLTNNKHEVQQSTGRHRPSPVGIIITVEGGEEGAVAEARRRRRDGCGRGRGGVGGGRREDGRDDGDGSELLQVRCRRRHCSDESSALLRCVRRCNCNGVCVRGSAWLMRGCDDPGTFI